MSLKRGYIVEFERVVMKNKRDKMIEILVENKIQKWVDTIINLELEEKLITGFKGYENYTYEELKTALKNELGKERTNEIKAILKRKKKNRYPLKMIMKGGEK